MLVHIFEGFAMSKVMLGEKFDAKSHSRAFSTVIVGPSMAVQSQKDEADINNIVKAFGVTGKVNANVRPPMYGDFTEVGDYRDALEAIRAADAAFLAMPSSLRERLGHDPQRFLEFCADPGNLEEMRKLGLAVPEPVAAPVASA